MGRASLSLGRGQVVPGLASATVPQSFTVGEALNQARLRLEPSPTASLDAQLLMAHALGTSRAWVLAHPEAALTAQQERAYQRLIEQRARGVPVAQLRGWVEWFGLELEVTPQVLIPRPETELVVEEAARLARRIGANIVADVGTGSGAIAIQLARELPRAHVYAVDTQSGALEVAHRNVARHGVASRVVLLQGNLIDPIPGRPDLLVANLPYLSDEMMTTLDRDVAFEPVRALHGGPTGLELYRQLFHQLSERGWLVPMVLEIDPRQAAAIRPLIGEFLVGRVEIMPDYAGLDRIVVFLPST